MTHTCPECNEPTVRVREEDDRNPDIAKPAWFRKCAECEWEELIEPDSD